MSGSRPKFASLAAEYKLLWSTVAVTSSKVNKIKELIASIKEGKAKYDTVSAATGVPWYVIGLIHSLESSLSFTKHLHNGDPLGAKTTHEPAGRPLTPPLGDWTHSAIDALEMKGMHNVGAGAWSIERIAFELERYNGFGYRMNSLNVLSPYLWSFTNHYTKGKYVRDHVYDPNFVSKQAGALAILKQMQTDGLALSQQGPVTPPPPPPPPIETGDFEVDARPFMLTKNVGDVPDQNSLIVDFDATVKKIGETTDVAWWKVQVDFSDGSTESGVAKRAWLRPVLVSQVVQESDFAQGALDSARRYGTSAHFLVALADAESGILNKPFEKGPFGPFAMTVEDWTAHNNKAETGVGDSGRFNPYAQVAVAARMVVKLTDELRALLPDKRLPTSEELYLARMVTPGGASALIAAPDDGNVRAVLEAKGILPPAVTRLFELRPSLLSNATKIKDLRTKITSLLTDGFAKAVIIIQKVEPDLVIGPPETVDEQKEVPWVGVARAQLKLPVIEKPGAASNAEIEKYFTATPLGPQTDDVAWCAAFISWCIKQAGGSGKHVNYSARAADWLLNGDQLDGPQFGAVAVTKPFAARSSGHVGFVVAWDGARVTLLGGNQRNADDREAVCEKSFSIADVRGWRMM